MNRYCDLHLHLGRSISQKLVRQFAQSDHDQYALDALGTDNTLNFSTSFQSEKDLFVNAFSYNPANGWNYRFGQSHSIEGGQGRLDTRYACGYIRQRMNWGH